MNGEPSQLDRIEKKLDASIKIGLENYYLNCLILNLPIEVKERYYAEFKQQIEDILPGTADDRKLTDHINKRNL